MLDGSVRSATMKRAMRARVSTMPVTSLEVGLSEVEEDRGEIVVAEFVA
jgi:hypothetical protein